MSVNYTFQKQVHPDTLHASLAFLPGFDGLTSTDTQVTVMFLQELSPANYALLEGIIEAHNSQDLAIIIKRKIERAKVRFDILATDFSTENVLLGITQAGKTKLIADTLRDTFYYGQTGSLYECLAALDAIVLTPEMSPFLTEERKAAFRQKVVNIINDI